MQAAVVNSDKFLQCCFFLLRSHLFTCCDQFPPAFVFVIVTAVSLHWACYCTNIIHVPAPSQIWWWQVFNWVYPYITVISFIPGLGADPFVLVPSFWIVMPLALLFIRCLMCIHVEVFHLMGPCLLIYLAVAACGWQYILVDLEFRFWLLVC